MSNSSHICNKEITLEVVTNNTGIIVLPQDGAATVEFNAPKAASVEVQSGYTRNYNNLSYKPSINGVKLIGNKDMEDLGVCGLTNLEIENLINMQI